MMSKKNPSEKTVRDIRRATRKQYSAEEKIGIVLDGLRGDDSIAELCRRKVLIPMGFYPVSADGFKKAEAAKSRFATRCRIRGLWNRSI